jgi:hypothetical protein
MTDSATIDSSVSGITNALNRRDTYKSISKIKPFSFLDYRDSFVAGFCGLSTAFAFMHPLDTLKTRMQAAATAGKLCWNQVLGKDTLSTLRRGFVASVVGAGPQVSFCLLIVRVVLDYLPMNSQSIICYDLNHQICRQYQQSLLQLF